MTDAPESPADDMRIAIEPKMAEELVTVMLKELLAFSDAGAVCKMLRQRFGLSEEDARLVADRVPGGIIRAITGNSENRPDPIKDPLAYIAFSRVWAELPRRHWFSRRKKPSGKWLEWFEELRKRMNNTGQPSGTANPASPGG